MPSVNFVSKPVLYIEDKIPPLPPKKYQTKELDLLSVRNNDGKDMEFDNQDSDFLTSSSHSMPTNQYY